MVDLTRVERHSSSLLIATHVLSFVSEYLLTSYLSSDPGLLTCFRLPPGWVLAALGPIRMAAAGFIGLYLSWCCSRCIGHPARITRHSDNQLLQLYDEEEHEASQEQPRPDPGREGSSLEECLERRRVGKLELQDY